ncbi:hypothetical protein, partial [Lysinibacillus xylanilyticus]
MQQLSSKLKKPKHKTAQAFFKKIFIITMIFTLIFTYSVDSASAVYTKVATQAAKKVAKDAVVDIAVSMAEDIIFNYQMEKWLSGKYDTEDGYKPVCLDKKTSDSGKCNKPAQVKEIKTSSDKKRLSDKIEEVLDRKTGTTGFKKFLDWFVPIFVIGGIISWIESALDPDSAGLFDDIAKESLDEIGFIKPVKPIGDTVILKEDGTDPSKNNIPTSTDNVTGVSNVFQDFQQTKKVLFTNGGGSESGYTANFGKLYSSKFGLYLQRHVSSSSSNFATTEINIKANGLWYGTDDLLKITQNGSDLRIVALGPIGMMGSSGAYITNVWANLNGQSLGRVSTSNGNYTLEKSPFTVSQIDSILIGPAYVDPSVDYSRKEISTDKTTRYFTRDIFIYAGANVLALTMNDGINNNPSEPLHSQIIVKEKHNTQIQTTLEHQITLFTNLSVVKFPNFTPTPVDIPVKANTTKIYVNIGTLPITTPDGTSVTPSKDSSTGWINRTTGEQIKVNEDDLTVGDVDPTLVPEPNPKPDPKPDPKPEPEPNPNPDKTKDKVGSQLGESLPVELILALLDMLRSILSFMVRTFTFIISIPSIPAIPIDSPGFVWFV